MTSVGYNFPGTSTWSWLLSSTFVHLSLTPSLWTS